MSLKGVWIPDEMFPPSQRKDNPKYFAALRSYAAEGNMSQETCEALIEYYTTKKKPFLQRLLSIFK